MVESKEKQKDRRSSYIYVPAVHVDSPSLSYPFQCAAVRLCLESRSTALLHGFVYLAVQSLFGGSRSKKA